MIPNLYIESGCFTKHPFINGCLGFQAMKNTCQRDNSSFNHHFRGRFVSFRGEWHLNFYQNLLKFTSSRTKNIQFSADFFVSLSIVNGVYSPKRHDSVNKTLGSVACSLSPLDDSVPKTGCFPMKSGQSPWHQQMGFNQRNQLKVSNVLTGFSSLTSVQIPS